MYCTTGLFIDNLQTSGSNNVPICLEEVISPSISVTISNSLSTISNESYTVSDDDDDVSKLITLYTNIINFILLIDITMGVMY